MIQIQNPEQFTKAAERLTRERMNVRKSEAHAYAVTNKAKGTRYTVRLFRRDGLTFGSCDCPAGIRHNRAPLVCKHLAAVVLFVRAMRAMRARAERQELNARR